jgi:hypothetical protein
MEEEAMDTKFNAYHSISEENLNTHIMIPSSPIDKLELIYDDWNCYAIINSLSLTKIDH